MYPYPFWLKPNSSLKPSLRSCLAIGFPSSGPLRSGGKPAYNLPLHSDTMPDEGKTDGNISPSKAAKTGGGSASAAAAAASSNPAGLAVPGSPSSAPLGTPLAPVTPVTKPKYTADSPCTFGMLQELFAAQSTTLASSQAAVLDSRLGPVEAAINTMEQKQDTFEQRLSALESPLADLGARLKSLESSPRAPSEAGSTAASGRSYLSAATGVAASPFLPSVPAMPTSTPMPFSFDPALPGTRSNEFNRQMDPTILKLTCKSLATDKHLHATALQVIALASIAEELVDIQIAKVARLAVIKFVGPIDSAAARASKVMAMQRLGPTEWARHKVQSVENGLIDAWINEDKSSKVVRTEIAVKAVVAIFSKRYPDLKIAAPKRSTGEILVNWKPLCQVEAVDRNTTKLKWKPVESANHAGKHGIDMDIINADFEEKFGLADNTAYV